MPVVPERRGRVARTGSRAVRIATAVAVAAVLGAIAGPASAQADDPAAAQDDDSPIALEITGEPIASWGEATLTRDDLVAYLLINVPPQDRGAFLRSDERLQKLLRQMLQPRVVANQGLDESMLDDPLVRVEMYQAAMNFLAEQWLEKVADRGELDSYEQQAREAYLRNPEQFRVPAIYDFTHLLVTGGSDATPPAVLDDIQRQIDDGRAFEALVTEFSEDPSLQRNQGSFVGVEASRLDPAFAAALETMDPGDIAGPVETSFGWHFIRLDDRQPSRIPAFEEVSAQLVQRARRAHRNEVKGDYLEALLDAPLEFDAEAIERIRDQAREGSLTVESD